MNPILKWPGGKTGELAAIMERIPPHARYIEPFLGGGAVYFALAPERALVNDASRELMELYDLLAQGAESLRAQLAGYTAGFAAVRALATEKWREPTLSLLHSAGEGAEQAALAAIIAGDANALAGAFSPVTVDDLPATLARACADKLRRTARHHIATPMQADDLAKNAITGYLSGCYLAIRASYNRMCAEPGADPAQRAAAFFFVREYCYGAMFRYNRAGGFNIPYGGASYNRKALTAKVEAAFAPEMRALLSRTERHNLDFANFLRVAAPGPQDFVFLDPPYDTAFSDYAGHAFTMADQVRLAACLRDMPARFLLVIQDTPRVRALYEGWAKVEEQAHCYTYNMRGRNARRAAHLYITNETMR